MSINSPNSRLFRVYEEGGFYSPERRIEIGSIPTIITDPHSEVLSLWMEIQNGPALLLHIDHHADMDAGAPTFTQAKQEYFYANIENYSDYAKQFVSVAAFISFAIHENKVGNVFWYDPRNDYIEAYGRVQNGAFVGTPKTKINEKGRIEWDTVNGRPKSENISIESAQEDIRSFNGPIILDIDLDAFLCTKEPVGQNPNIMFDRLGKFKMFIQSLNRKPDIISIARSQTPSLWTPPEKVDEIEMEVIKILEEIF